MICHHYQQSCHHYQQSALNSVLVFLTVSLAHLTIVLAMFRSHLANSSEHQRQLWAQSRPGISRWFALLTTLVGDPAPALAGSASQYWVRVNAAMGLCTVVGNFLPADGAAPAELPWAGVVPQGSQHLERDVLPPLSAPLTLRWWREGRATRPRKLLCVFKLPFVPR